MSEWREYRIEDFGEIQNHKRIPLSAMERTKRKGSFPYYGASGIVDYVDGYLFDGEYVLISEDGENLRTRNTPIAFKAKGRFWVNNHAHVLRAKGEITTNQYLKYFLDSFDYHNYVNGTTRLKLTQGAMNQIPVRLAPKKEQHRIVATLETVLGKVDTCQKRLEKIRVIPGWIRT